MAALVVPLGPELEQVRAPDAAALLFQVSEQLQLDHVENFQQQPRKFQLSSSARFVQRRITRVVFAIHVANVVFQAVERNFLHK